MEIYFRHKTFRPIQKIIINDVYNAIEKGNNMLIHAPCGSGKTDSVLSPAITYAVNNGKNVFFLTPKIAQHNLAIEVIKGISKKYDLELKAVDMIGRKYSCINPIFNNLDMDSFYTACEKLRKEERCLYYNRARGNTKLEEIKADIRFKKILEKYGNVKTNIELKKICEKESVCPYEIMLKLSSISNIIIADYFHILSKSIRELFLLKSKKKLENSIIIVDEAHNLPSRIRSFLSTSFNTYMFSALDKEMKFMGEESNLLKIFKAFAKEKLKGKKEVETNLEDFIKILPDMSKDELIDYYEAIGVEYVERTNKKSYSLLFSRFLEKWFDDTASFRKIKGYGDFFSISKKFLDPSLVVSALNDSHSSILMSATLRPLEMYRDILGLDPLRTELKEYPSSFSKDNKLNLILTDVTTKFSKRNAKEFEKIANIIDELYDGKTAVFFASYDVLNATLPFIKTKRKLVQNKNMSPTEINNLINTFSFGGGLLLGVQGGSLSEGLDFKNNEITTLIIVGIGLEEMNLETKALIEYYQKKFGKGWEYAYIYPGVSKVLQSAGRAIRKETDKAVIVFLDERFNWKNYKKLLPKDERYIITNFNSAKYYINRFWMNKH